VVVGELCSVNSQSENMSAGFMAQKGELYSPGQPRAALSGRRFLPDAVVSVGEVRN
jgi:hypothetical protein